MINFSPQEFTMFVGSAQLNLLLATFDLENKLRKLENAFLLLSSFETAEGSTNSWRCFRKAVTWYCRVLFSSDTCFTDQCNVASGGNQIYPSSMSGVDVAPLTACLK